MSAISPPDHTPTARSGVPFALGAYTLWGVLPLYLVLLNSVNPFALVGWRVIWTLPLCVLALLVRRQIADVIRALGRPRVLAMLALSGSLITLNWIVYVVAVQRGEFFAASLGYYINPLINVLLGTVLLRERLSMLQWLAVGVAAIGVAVLAAGAGSSLIISLALAFSFAFYGLIRKRVDVGALPGLSIEVMLLAIPAVATVWLMPASDPATPGGLPLQGLLLGAGVMTAVPLVLFAEAARRLDYSVLGFFQFLAPTLVFIFGLTILKEPLEPLRLVSFIFIWIAIALFCTDLVLRQRKRRIAPIA